MKLALVMPYYRNPRMLIRQLIVWRYEWSSEMKRDIEIVIVDDASPDETAAEAIKLPWDGDRTDLPSLSLYRVTHDRPWHQHGARNLGASVAIAPWLLMTDIDHVVPPSTLSEVLSLLPLQRREVITFGRVDAPATLTWKADDWSEFARTVRADGSLKPHVNSFVVERNHFWKVGGYDEAYCGVYGTDIEFRRRLFDRRTNVRHLDHAPLIRVAREVIADASTRDFARKDKTDVPGKRRILAMKTARGERKVIKTLQFTWERVL